MEEGRIMKRKIRTYCLTGAAVLWVLALSGAGPADMETGQSCENTGCRQNPEDSSKEIFVLKSPMYTEEGDVFVPEQELERDGKKYHLVSCIREDSVTDGRTRQVSAEIFCILEGEDSPPETAVILIRDDDTGQEVECTGFLTDAEEKRSSWSEEFSFPVTVSGYGSDSFFLGETEIPGDQEPSEWGGKLLQYLGLPEKYYQVTSVQWTGEPYERDGVFMRDAEAAGKKQIREVKALYEGTAELPPIRGYVYRCTYEQADTRNSGTGDSEVRPEKRQEPEKESRPETGAENLPEPVGLLEKIAGWLQYYMTVVKIGAGFILGILLTIWLLRRSLRKQKQEKEL